MSHHYDTHDRDKLARWRADLLANPIGGDGFPALALFLVKPQSVGAHEIFRRYRREFEPRNAGFASLVIFGMHGVSDTARRLLALAGLSETDLPTLLLAPAANPMAAVAIKLPSGASLDGDDDPNANGTCDYLPPWQDALDRIRIAKDGRILRLMGVQGRRLDGVDLTEMAAAALSGPT